MKNLEGLKQELYQSVLKSKENGSINITTIIVLRKMIDAFLSQLDKYSNIKNEKHLDEKNDLMVHAMFECAKYFDRYKFAKKTQPDTEWIKFDIKSAENHCFIYFKTVIFRSFTLLNNFKTMKKNEF